MADLTKIPGLIPDQRTEEEKDRDFPHQEIYGAPVLEWKENPPANWKQYSLKNQNGSSSCVGMAGSKAFEVKLGTRMSARPFYYHRANKPGLGMWLQDLGRIGVKIGTVREELCPSENLSESQMDMPLDMSQFPANEIRKAKAYLFVNPKDIDAMAQVLDAGHALILTFGSNYDEWTEIPVYKGGAVVWGHAVCNPKDRTLWTGQNYQNEKALVIDESWGVGIKKILPVDGKRVITEAFIKERCTGCMYFIFEEAPTPPVKPVYNFANSLYFGMAGNAEVKVLQKCLMYLGLMINDTQFATGNYYQMTAKAVLDFQKKYQVAPLTELENLGGKIVGPKTRMKLNQLFGQ